MSTRTTIWLAWLLGALSLIVIGADMVFAYLNDPAGLVGDVFGAAVMLAFTTVGAVVIARRPAHVIGWLLAGGMLLTAIGSLALEYAVYALLTLPRSLPGGEWMLWFGGWTRSLGFYSLIVFVPLFFPDGKAPSPRWRPIAWFAVAIAVLFTCATMFAPTNEAELRLPPLPNPLGIALPSGIYDPLSGLSFLVFGIITLVSAASVVLRLRRAGGVEREQLKWFAYAGLVAAVILGFLLAGMLLLPSADMENTGVFFDLALAGFPIAVGFAILRYRLYDIDLIIRRTLVYSILTALLALVYFGLVVLLQQVFVRVTGETQSEIVTVVSTLAIAALFVPLRGRVQNWIDRRFYRKKYDAQHVLQDFAAAMRDETDLEKLAASLVQVVNETMQPKSASLWLRQLGRGAKQ